MTVEYDKLSMFAFPFFQKTSFCSCVYLWSLASRSSKAACCSNGGPH